MHSVSRRRFLITASASLAAASITLGDEVRTPILLDHILLGSSDLDDGIAFVERRTGVRAAFGGVHPG
ncbi:MAG: VOC family protein, partial [Candidatus Acidiferrum sp.]